MKRESKKKRGGARVGAGRKPAPGVPIYVRVTEEAAEAWSRIPLSTRNLYVLDVSETIMQISSWQELTTE